MVLKNQGVFANYYDLSNIKMNLNALRVLRNKVSHHNFLLSEIYSECSVDGLVDNTLKHNINNLKFFLPDEFRKGFSMSINNCAKGLVLLNKEIIL